MAAYLTCWRIRYAGVLRGRPRCPLVFWAGFCAGLRNAAAVVLRAAEGLRFGLDCADWLLDWRCTWAALEGRPDLAREGLALAEGIASCCTDGVIDWDSPLPSIRITIALSQRIITP